MSGHRCARGHRCAHAERAPEPHGGGLVGAPLDAPQGLCRACDRALARHLRDLPRLYVALEVIIGDHRRTGGEHVSGTREQPIPPRLDVLTVQAGLDAVAAQWAAPLARRCRIPWDAQAVRRLRAGPRLTRAARLLTHNLDAWLALPHAEFAVLTPHGVLTTKRSGLDGALEAFALSERGWRAVTGGPGHDRLPLPCPQCEGSLVRYNGSDQVNCEHCDARWPESDYRHLCLVLAESMA